MKNPSLTSYRDRLKMRFAGRTLLNKGKVFERFCTEQMRELGWKDCITTREAKGGNWAATDDGIDLVDTDPFSIQCKSYAKYHSVSKTEEITPEEGKIPLLLMKADHKPVMAVLPWEELKKLIRECYPLDKKADSTSQ